MRRLTNLLFVVAFSLSLLPGCPVPGPSPVPENSKEDCVRACARLESIKDCDLWKPTPGGKPCLEWCDYYRQKPAGIDPICLSKVTTCEETDDCGR